MYEGNLATHAPRIRWVLRRSDRLWNEAIRILEGDYQPGYAIVNNTELTRNAIFLMDLMAYWRNFLEYFVKWEARPDMYGGIDMRIPDHLRIDLSIPLQRMIGPRSPAIGFLLMTQDHWLSYVVHRVFWLQNRQVMDLPLYPARDRYLPNFFVETSIMLKHLESQWSKLFSSLSPLLSYEWSRFLFLVNSSTLWRIRKFEVLESLLNYYLSLTRRPMANDRRKLLVTDVATDCTFKAAELNEQECCICLNSYHTGESSSDQDAERPFRMLQCGHVFGGRCLQLLIDESRWNRWTCPLCRQYVWVNASNLPRQQRGKWQTIEKIEESVVKMDEKVDAYLREGYRETHVSAFAEVMKTPTDYHNAIVDWSRAKEVYEKAFHHPGETHLNDQERAENDLSMRLLRLSIST